MGCYVFFFSQLVSVDVRTMNVFVIGMQKSS